MKRLSLRSERYLQAFSRWLRWYPLRFRKQFGDEMILLLRDQLRDAERSGDTSMLREIYLRALSELPASIVREQLGAVWSLNETISRWKLFSYWYFLTVAIAAVVVTLPTENVLPIQIVVVVLVPLLSVMYAAWQYSGRISLALLTGASLFGVTGVISLIAMASPVTVDFVGTLPISLVFLFFVAVLAFTPYSLLIWFRSRPEKFARRILATLSDEEINALRVANAHKRKIALFSIAGIAIILIIPNLIALYDPAYSAAKEYPLAHKIEKGQNAYYLLSSLSIPQDIYNAHSNVVQPDLTPYVTGKAWDETKIQAFLAESETVHSQFIKAAELPAYQAPTMEDPENEPTTAYTPLPDLSTTNVAANLELIRGIAAVRNNQLDSAIQSGVSVLKVYSAIDNSNTFYLQHLVALNDEEKAIDFLKTLTPLQLSSSQREEIVATLPTTDSIWKNTKNALRWEVYYNLKNLPGYENNTNLQDEFLPYMTYVPYMYQPNRTAKLVVASLHDTLAEVGVCPGKIQPPSNSGSTLATFKDYLKFNGVGQVLAKYSLSYFDSAHECSLISSRDQLLTTLGQTATD